MSEWSENDKVYWLAHKANVGHIRKVPAIVIQICGKRVQIRVDPKFSKNVKITKFVKAEHLERRP